MSKLAWSCHCYDLGAYSIQMIILVEAPSWFMVELLSLQLLLNTLDRLLSGLRG